MIRDCLAWIAESYATANPVTAMAERSGLTKRTFARRFQAATGNRPIEYVHALRIERARQLIESRRRRDRRRGLPGGLRGPDILPPALQADHGPDSRRYRRKFAPIAAAR